MSLYKNTMGKLKLRETETERAKMLYRKMEQSKNKEENTFMRKGKVIRRIAMAGVAVCLAVVAVTGIGDKAWKQTVKNAKDGHAFTLYVNAAELEEGKSVTLSSDTSKQSWAFSGNEDDNEMSYVIEMPVTCTGDDIDTITYEINKGAFQIDQMPDENIVVNGQLCNEQEMLNVGNCGSVEDEEGNIISETKQYKSFTVNYDRQTGEQFWISICGVTDYFDGKLFPGAFYDLDDYTIQDECDAINRMLDGVEITCTVHFKDGTTHQKTLSVGAEVKPNSEAGDADIIEKEAADAESVYIVYTMK